MLCDIQVSNPNKFNSIQREFDNVLKIVENPACAAFVCFKDALIVSVNGA